MNKNYTKTTSMRRKVGKMKVSSTISASRPFEARNFNTCLASSSNFQMTLSIDLSFTLEVYSKLLSQSNLLDSFLWASFWHIRAIL